MKLRKIFTFNKSSPIEDIHKMMEENKTISNYPIRPYVSDEEQELYIEISKILEKVYVWGRNKGDVRLTPTKEDEMDIATATNIIRAIILKENEEVRQECFKDPLESYQRGIIMGRQKALDEVLALEQVGLNGVDEWGINVEHIKSLES